MSSTVPSLQRGVFEDEVVNSSTLAKQTSTVLDHAAQGRLVTITRNNEAFALVSRDYASWLVKANKQMGEVCQVLAAASQRLMGEPIDMINSHQWVSVLGEKDLRKMVTEVVALLDKAVTDHSVWEEIDASIYEWKESCSVAHSSELRHAFNTPNEKLALSQPVATK